MHPMHLLLIESAPGIRQHRTALQRKQKFLSSRLQEHGLQDVQVVLRLPQGTGTALFLPPQSKTNHIASRDIRPLLAPSMPHCHATGDALTPEICREAVNQHGGTIRLVPAQNDELQLAALRSDPYSIRWMASPSLNVIMHAVRAWGQALQFVPGQDEEICTTALNNDGDCLHYVHRQNPGIRRRVFLNGSGK